MIFVVTVRPIHASLIGGRLRQREFFTFGMAVLLKLDLKETRQFFSAFFSLSDFHWRVS